MAVTNVVNGDIMIIEFDGTALAHTTSNSISISSDLPDATTKDSGGWTENFAGNNSWSGSADGLVSFVEATGAKDLTALAIAKTVVTIKFTTNVVGQDEYEGEARLSDVSIDSPQGAPVTYSLSFEGCGVLTQTTIV